MPKRSICSCIRSRCFRCSEVRRVQASDDTRARDGRISPRSGIVWQGKATPAAFVGMVQAPNETSALKIAIGQFNIRREDQSCAKRSPTEVAYCRG